MKNSVVLFLFSAALSAASCSVKESREGGSCWFYENAGGMLPVEMTVWRDGSVLLREETVAPHTYELEVERGVIEVTAAVTTSHSYYSDGMVMVSDRFPIDSIYAYCARVDCSGEWAVDTLVPHKQFATVTIRIAGDSFRRRPDSLEIISPWNGLDVRDMRPLRGEYHCAFHVTGDELSFRLLRQGDNSLALRMSSVTGELSEVMPLGEIIAKSGYDWREENLTDIDLILMENGVNLKVIIADWITGDPLEFEL